MCGRFTQAKSRKDVLKESAPIELPPLFHGRYNVAPTQTIATIQQEHPDRAVESVWGLKTPHSGAPIINARSETLHERPTFKPLLHSNRCLIFADGFYEWDGKQPYYFQLPDRQLFAFAGLHSANRSVIITRAADENMRGIHDRMPLILTAENWEQWLHSPSVPCSLFDIQHSLTCRPVSRRANSVAHDNPRCLDPGEIQTSFL